MLLKFADKINDVKKTKEIVTFVADMVSYIKLFNTPASALIAQSMGVVKCGANVYERTSLSQNQTPIETLKLRLSCVKSILLVSNFKYIELLDRVDPDKILVNFVKSVYGKDDTYLRKIIYFMLEQFNGIVVSSLDNVLFKKLNDEINSTIESIRFLRKFNSLDDKETLKIKKSSLEVEKISLMKDNVESGLYFTNGMKIVDTCRRRRESFLDSLVNLNLVPAINSYESINFKKGQIFYRIIGDSCLIVVE